MCRRWSLSLAKVCSDVYWVVTLLSCCIVARMAKVRNWYDVRLLSFDLQTVEFSYASVRLSCVSSLAEE